MLTKGRTYQFKADGNTVLLEDKVTHEYENVRADLIYLFERSEQVKLIPGVITLKPGDEIECILDTPITFGVDSLYYPFEHTSVYNRQNNVITELFPGLSEDELAVMHKVIIPQNLRNDVISVNTLKQLTKNFVKQSLAVFARSVYESAKNKVNREIVMKLIFGVYSINKLKDLSLSRNKLVVSDTNNDVSISYLGDVIASYDYPSIREEESG